MPWVSRGADKPPSHICAPPTKSLSNKEGIWRDIIRPDGSQGDLWRCDHCNKLWEIGGACDLCNAYGTQPHLGTHEVGLKWRHARDWQVFKQWFKRNK